MADSFAESSGSPIGPGGTGQGSVSPPHQTAANCHPEGSSSAACVPSTSSPAFPPPADAADSGLTALVAPISATPAVFGTSFMPGTTPPVVAVSPTVHTPTPAIEFGVAGGAEANLMTWKYPTTWDPTLSSDWDNERASQPCILRIKR